MLDVLGMLAALERPKLLVNAARIGVDDYQREYHLRRVLRHDHPPRPAAAMMALLEREAVMEEQRRTKKADYRIARHLDLLIALMGEARILRATTRPKEVGQAAHRQDAT